MGAKSFQYSSWDQWNGQWCYYMMDNDEFETQANSRSVVFVSCEDSENPDAQGIITLKSKSFVWKRKIIS